MDKKEFKIADLFNFVSRGKELTTYTLTLSRPEQDLDAQAQNFADTLTRWLHMQGDDFKGNAKLPKAADAVGANARVSIEATEEMMARIERQFGGDILKSDPPPQHARGTVYPPKVDPWDVTKW